jgi:hypothetical protein
VNETGKLTYLIPQTTLTHSRRRGLKNWLLIELRAGFKKVKIRKAGRQELANSAFPAFLPSLFEI